MQKSALPEMASIPAGPFLMGSDPRRDPEARAWELPQHVVHLPAYHLARTPVTNGQFLAFVQATGYYEAGHLRAILLPGDRVDHPVVNVTWHEAQAYCAWLAEVTGRPYRLPSEAEWEKGARGPYFKGARGERLYPWGNVWENGRCHVGVGMRVYTAPVGAYPQEASPFGLLALVGNVREWTLSLWGEQERQSTFHYPYDPQDGREDQAASNLTYRVVRGACYADLRANARCAFRTRYPPYQRSRRIGFRVALPGETG